MIDILIMIFCTIGALFILVSAIGIYRMPDFYTRLSVTVKASTVGVGFILLAVAIYFLDFSVSTKVFAIIFFLLLTSPVAAFMISRTAYVSGIKLWDKTHIDELKDSKIVEEINGKSQQTDVKEN